MKSVSSCGVILLLMLAVPAFAQNVGVLAGKITDASSGAALPGANILIEGTVLGTSADPQGHFVIRQVQPGTYRLRASMLGYRTQVLRGVTVKARETTSVEVRLEAAAIDLNPVIVTAVKGTQNLSESPTSISVLSATQIEARNNLRLDQALQVVGGVHFIEDQINIRGSSGYTRSAGSRVLLLVDGVPVIQSDIGAIIWDLIPVTEVERVEVVKGAGSALYGSYALGGVINVITKSPTPEGRLRLRTTGGIYDNPSEKIWDWTDRTLHYDRQDVSYSRQFGNLGVRLAAGHYESTGYKENGYFNRWNGAGKLTYRFPNASQITLLGAWSKDRRGEPLQWAHYQNQFYKVSESDRRLWFRLKGFYLVGQYDLPLSASVGFKLRGSYFSALMGNQSSKSDAEFDPGIGWGAEIQGDWIARRGHHLTYGVEYKRDGGNTLFFGKRSAHIVAPYVQDRWQVFRNLTVTAGLRYDLYQLGRGDSSHVRRHPSEPAWFDTALELYGDKEKLLADRTDAQVSPKLSVTYSLTPTTILRSSAGRGFRPATIGERFSAIKFVNAPYRVKPNPDLKPEKSWSVEVGLRQEVTPEWFVDVAAFHNEYWDLVEAVPRQADITTIEAQFTNLTPRARVRGLEVSSGGRWWTDRLALQASVTWMDPKDITSDQPLPYRPKVLFVLSPAVRIGPVQFQADYRYASRLARVLVFTEDQRVPMKVLDVRMLYRWRPFTVIAGINNAMNYNYAQLERNIRENRNFFGSVLVEL